MFTYVSKLHNNLINNVLRQDIQILLQQVSWIKSDIQRNIAYGKTDY